MAMTGDYLCTIAGEGEQGLNGIIVTSGKRRPLRVVLVRPVSEASPGGKISSF